MKSILKSNRKKWNNGKRDQKYGPGLSDEKVFRTVFRIQKLKLKYEVEPVMSPISGYGQVPRIGTGTYAQPITNSYW